MVNQSSSSRTGFPDFELKILVVDSLVLSDFNYWDVVCGTCLGSYDDYRIKNVQNCYIRHTVNLKLRDHVCH